MISAYKKFVNGLSKMSNVVKSRVCVALHPREQLIKKQATDCLMLTARVLSNVSNFITTVISSRRYVIFLYNMFRLIFSMSRRHKTFPFSYSLSRCRRRPNFHKYTHRFYNREFILSIQTADSCPSEEK